MKYPSIIRHTFEPKLTMILLHGLGSDEQDMFGLAQLINDQIEVICMRAPKQYGPGFAWFDIAWTADGIRIDESECWSAVDQLALEIESMNIKRLILGGFSQGAMMTLGIISKYPDLASDGVMLSGRGIGNPCPTFEGSLFQGHGRFDEVIPISEARSLRTSLGHLEDRLEYHEYPIGHSICDEELVHLNAWLEMRL